MVHGSRLDSSCFLFQNAIQTAIQYGKHCCYNAPEVLLLGGVHQALEWRHIKQVFAYMPILHFCMKHYHTIV